MGKSWPNGHSFLTPGLSKCITTTCQGSSLDGHPMYHCLTGQWSNSRISIWASAPRDFTVKRFIKIFIVWSRHKEKECIYSICLSIIQVSPYLGVGVMCPHVYTTNCLTPDNIHQLFLDRPKRNKWWWDIVRGNEEEASFVSRKGISAARSAGLCEWVKEPNIWVHAKVTSPSLSGLGTGEGYTDFQGCLCLHLLYMAWLCQAQIKEQHSCPGYSTGHS